MVEINNENFQKAFSVFIQPKEYVEDCVRIVNIAKDSFNIEMTLPQAEALWQAKSDASFAGWLCISNDEEVKDEIEYFVTKYIDEISPDGMIASN